MTVSYQYEVASSTSGGFTRLLLMWRGSLYKLIYRELLLYLILFGILSALYRHVFTTEQKREFEQIVIYCDCLIKLIPLSFVLGFYVSYVAQRWWKQYTAIPWPDKVMHLVALYVTGNDDYSRMLRRALMRYLNLSLILVLRSISSAVKRRFPTLDHVVDSGFMTALELQLYQSVPSVEFNTYWIPCTWFINLLKEARKNHRISDAQGLKLIMEVAEQLINPFGDDDEDFELNWLIDRHTKVSYLGVDTLMNRCPPLVKDIYYDSENVSLPYTEAAAAYKKETYRGSVANMTVPEEKQMMFLPGILEEEEECTTILTPRTSTASLANPNDSPVNERRQISGSPSTSAKMARNCSETVVQLDSHEQPPAETEQRRVIVEAVRKFSSLAKSSTSRAGKPFFPVLTKSPKPVLSPWPSAINISYPVQIPTSIPTSAVIETEGPWRKDSFRSLQARRLSQEDSEGRPSVSSQGEKNQEGAINSAFVEWKVDDISDICDCDDGKEGDDCSCSDPSHQSQSRHVSCQLSSTPETIDMSVIGGEPSHLSIQSSPKYLMVRDRWRDRSVSDSRKKKGIHWPSKLSGKSKFRRRTTDSVPTVGEILNQARSSPNLKNLEEQEKIVQSVKAEPPCEQEEVSKL
ncbi:bestrophin-2 isoform X2 [Solenopsis invicta]|uniref:bestrophin-2 isoform X2 n=1 Tax=Solenopsis invicta TaxID=13686 RepID=UPI000E33F8FE|nr:bestrophin-2 isoform X2 [Solenopsis invicta]